MAIGYASLTVGIRAAKIKSCMLKNATHEKLAEIIKSNLLSLTNIIKYNSDNNIRLFRISSDIIPFGSHPANTIKWWIIYNDYLDIIGQTVTQNNIRLSMHPGQYTVINSPDDDVVKKSIADLEYHANFLDSLGMDISNKIIIHIGGVYGDRYESLKRFECNCRLLPRHVKDRLVIENDERCYSIADVYDMGCRLHIPVVFDNLHHQVNPGVEKYNEYEWIKKCSDTWTKKDGNQKIHYSEQLIGAKAGYHSNTINAGKFISFYNALGENGIDEEKTDIMLEVKDKNLSALKCIHCVQQKVPIVLLEREWAKYKYLILSCSHQNYNRIRTLLNDKTAVSSIDFYNLIDDSILNDESKGEQRNAALHIWGYFKKYATPSEKNGFLNRLNKYMNDQIRLEILKNYLFRLAQKYKVDYLLDSYYFYL